MTARQKHLIKASFGSVQEMAGPVALLFYGRLFELDPSLRHLFPDDMKRQGAKLMEMLSAVVENLEGFDTLTPVLHAMGQRHVSYGVLPRHYEIVERALIWALCHTLESDPGSEVCMAWQTVIQRINAVMKEGADLPKAAS